MANTSEDATADGYEPLADGSEDITLAANANTETRTERSTETLTMDYMVNWETFHPQPENLVLTLTLQWE